MLVPIGIAVMLLQEKPHVSAVWLLSLLFAILKVSMHAFQGSGCGCQPGGLNTPAVAQSL